LLFALLCSGGFVLREEKYGYGGWLLSALSSTGLAGLLYNWFCMGMVVFFDLSRL
jgi:hypothetical protein